MAKEQLKQPERPVYKKPLFWTTILFGFLSFFLMIMVFVVDSHYVELTNALAKHNLYYSSKDKDIYYNVTNSEQNTSSSTTTSTSKSEEKFNVDVSDKHAWMKTFSAIRSGKSVSWSDMIIVETQYSLELDKMLEMTDNPTEQQKMSVKNSKEIMKKTVDVYRNAEHDNRDLSKEEKDKVLLNISEMLRTVYLFTNQH
jgi:hypothetical protein